MAKVTFKAMGKTWETEVEVGKSLAERDMADTAREIMEKADQKGCRLYLPKDIVVAQEFKAGAESEVLPVDQCPPDAMILDAGPHTVTALTGTMDMARTLVWNGPLGAFELEPFDAGTVAAAREAAARARRDTLIAVAGGGDTVSALNHAGVAEDFTFVSTAGGAFLEWMEGKPLPGVEALKG